MDARACGENGCGDRLRGAQVRVPHRTMAIHAAAERGIRIGDLDGRRALRMVVATRLDRDGVSPRRGVQLHQVWHAFCSSLKVVEPDSHIDVSSTVATKRRVNRRLALWLSVGFVALLIVAGVIFVANVPLSSDILRQRIIESLSDKLDSDVEVGGLQLRVYPVLRAEGTNLTIRRRGAASDLPPLIAVKSFHVDGSLFGMWSK